MIVTKGLKDQEAYGVVRKGLSDLLLRFSIAGFSLLGEAVDIVEDTSIKTLCTNGRKIWYSPVWIRRVLSEKGPVYVVFDLLHEWLHVFFNHPARCGDRDKRVWNEACDIFIAMECERILGVPPPPDHVQPREWAKNMTVEQIYDYLFDNPDEQQLEEADMDMVFVVGLSPAEDEDFRAKFVEDIQTATAIMEKLRKTKPDFWGDAIGSRLVELSQPHVPWQRLFRSSLVASMGHDMVVWTRPNRKYLPDILLPTSASMMEETLVILVDISASVGKRLLNIFATEIVPAARRARETYVITFDAVIREEIRTRRPKQILKELKFSTGAHSGTSVRGCFERIDQIRPSGIACLTDGYIWLPDKPYPNTHWVVPENGPTLPWGNTYHMKTSW